MINLAMGQAILVTGVEDDLHGSIRVYIGPRYEANYFILTDPSDIERVRRVWADVSTHPFMARRDVPWEVVFHG